MTAAAGSRNEDAFAAFFRAQIPALRGYVRTLVVPDEVEAVVSASLATAWKHFDRTPPPGRAWLFAVARNHVRNTVRADRGRTALVGALTDLRPDADAQLHAGRLDPAVAEQFVAALGRLSEADREIVQLSAWHELQPPEIAEVLRIDANAARVRLHRARTRLQQLLVQADAPDAPTAEGGAR